MKIMTWQNQKMKSPTESKSQNKGKAQKNQGDNNPEKSKKRT